ncbi:MAG TPA: hypothetical protein DEP84_33775, partial [Chloroflexi bacterium]|nr:hypothetical protein [Chloroflexota bacterium]
MKTKVFPHWLLVVGLFIVGSLAIGPSALAGPALVDPPVYTWTGLGANIGWMAPKNWNPEGRPGSGSELVFPEDAWYEYRTNYNNFLPGKNFSSITLEDSQYTLNGNRVSVEGIYDYGPPRSWGNSGANRINLDLSRKMGTTLLPLHVYVNDSNHTLWVYGTVDRTSDIFKEGAGALWLKGAGNWADEYLFVEAGTLLLDGDLSAPAGTYVGGVYPATDGVLDLRDTLNTGALDVRNSSTVRFNLAPGGLEGYIRTTGRPIFSPNSSLDINVWNDFIPPHSRRFVLIVNGSDQDALSRPKYYGTVYTLAEGETFTPNGPAQRFAITYSGGDGNDVVIMPAARIGVYVKDHLGAPLGGWTVRLRNPNQWNRSATTNSRGYAEFWVYPNNAHDPYVDEYTVCPVLGDGWVQTGVEGGSVEGSCTVFSWDGLTDSELDTAWDQAVTFTNIRKADLAISQSASPDPALRGGDLSYVVSLRSFGPGRHDPQ